MLPSDYISPGTIFALVKDSMSTHNEGPEIVDCTRSGHTCRTLKVITTHDDPLPFGLRGTIQHEMKTAGYHLVFVQWENGREVPVFIDEIEIGKNLMAKAA